MTLILEQNVMGQARGAPIVLPSRRRRLSTIAKRHAPVGRPYIVSVHRRGEAAFLPTDPTVRLRASWSRTLVGPQDVVLITVCPLGGGGSSGSKGKSGVGIGLALASIALIALAGPLAGVLAPVIGASTSAVQAGLVIGGLALSFAAKLANSSKKADKSQPNYSVTGGGNIPKPGQRKPLQYGTCWSSPPLSQADFTIYAGPQMYLYKRITLGIGEYHVRQVRIGDALYWDEGSGLQPPFNIADPDPAKSAAIELLYEQPSAIVPGDVISSPDVTGQELPRAGANPDWTPWFRVSPVGVEIDKIHVDYQWPAGLVHNGTKGQGICYGHIIMEARRVDPTTGAPAGEPSFLIVDDTRAALTTTAIRQTQIIDVANGCYEVRAQNVFPLQPDYENRASWDGLRGWINDIRVRPKTFEIAMRVPAGQGLTITAFSDVQVLATRKLPLWTGTGWTAPTPTDKAVWAYVDLVRSEYGLNQPDGADVERALYYVDEAADLGIEGRDTYSGVLPEVSSFWEAASEVLHPLRADPVKIGTVHTFVRDESQTAPRHVISRRQIVVDSGQASYQFAQDEGDGSDIIVEFAWAGDPKRPGEVRYSYGPHTRTPKRYKVAGITDGTHALHHAKWLAAIAVFRGSTRKVTTEWDGRLVSPGDHILSDLWFLKGKAAAGVSSIAYDANGAPIVTTDTDLPQLGSCWASIRLRSGREWASNGTSLLPAAVVGRRTLALDTGSVIALEGLTGRSLLSLLALDTQDPTTLVIGSELTELQETYVARSAIPVDEDHVTIEMVLDDTRVWQILGETIHVPQPPFGTAEDPLLPSISTLHARCERIETTIELIWSVTPARGAVAYEIVLSYDNGVTWEALYTGPLALGRNAIHQSDGPMTVGARAYGRTGLPGEWVYVTFTTTAPLVRGEFLEDDSIKIEKLAAEIRSEIADINRVGEALITGAKGLIRDQIKILDDKVEQLAAAAASIETNAYYQRSLIKVQVRSNFAAIDEEREVRVSETEALARVQTSLGARLTNAEGTLTGQAAAISSIQTSVTSISGVLTAQASSIVSLDSRVTSAEGSVSGQATAVQSLSTRVTVAEGAISSTSQFLTALQSTVLAQGGQIAGQAAAVGSLQTSVSSVQGQISAVSSTTTALQTTVGGHTSTLTIQGQSIDGIRARYGVALAFNGTIGGFVIYGFQDLAGNAAITAGFDVQAFAITNGQPRKTPFAILDDKVFINDLIVQNANLLAGAVSQAVPAVGISGNQPVLYMQPKRPGSFIAVFASYSGNEDYEASRSAGSLVLFRDGIEMGRSAVGADRLNGLVRLTGANFIGLYQSPANNPIVQFATGNTGNLGGQGNTVLIGLELSV